MIKIKRNIKRLDKQNLSNRFSFAKERIILFVFIASGLLSCGEPEIRLTRAERKMIDTLFNHKIDSISPIIDSLCNAEKSVLVQQAADSIIKERKQKEMRLRLQ